MLSDIVLVVLPVVFRHTFTIVSVLCTIIGRFVFSLYNEINLVAI